MYSASIKLNLGKNAKEYFQLLDKRINYKRSRLKISSSGDTIHMEIQAQDPVALIASINSILKQFRIMGNAQKLFED